MPREEDTARHVVVDLKGRVHWGWERDQESSLCACRLSFITPKTSEASIKVLEDNQGAKALIKIPLSSARSKHIDVRFYFIRDLYRTRKISEEYVASAEQHVDILTETLSRANFHYHRKRLINILE